MESRGRKSEDGWFYSDDYDPNIYTLKAEIFGPYPPGSQNDPIWYFGGDSLRFWTVKVEIDEELSSPIFAIPSDTNEVMTDSLRTVFRILPDSASVGVSFVHSPAANEVTYWHCVTAGTEETGTDTVKGMREFRIDTLETVGSGGEDQWKYIWRWSQRDDEGEWLNPAEGPFESHIMMRWEREEEGRESIWRWMWDRHKCKGLRLYLVVYGGDGESEIWREVYQAGGGGVYVPLNWDHDNGYGEEEDRDVLIDGWFTDDDLVRFKLWLETDEGEWDGEGELSAQVLLACSGGRVRVWRGNTGGDGNLLVDPDGVDEYVWDLEEGASGIPGFIGTREEFLTERDDLWVEGYRTSENERDVSVMVGVRSGSYEYVDHAMFTVARVETMIQPVLNHRFVIQTMPPHMPEIALQAGLTPVDDLMEFQYKYRVCAGNHPERLLEYEDAPPGYDHPTPRQSAWLEENAFAMSWTMPFSNATVRDSFFGGHFDSVMVWTRPVYDGIIGHKIERGLGGSTDDYGFYIVGGPLLRDNVVQYVNQLTGDSIEQTMLEAIAQTETNFTHFAPHPDAISDSTSLERYPIESFDHGFGVMQLTPPPSRVEIWNWQANVEGALMVHVRPGWIAGSSWLNEHPEHPGGITDRMRMLETYARYRGGTNEDNEPPKTYHYWYDHAEPPRWLRRPVLCGCDDCDTNGQYVDPQGATDCFPSIVCYADEAEDNEGP